ncbi:phosphonate metabolism protein/1,5-bisphosphokinase (PRPP-forming) PhnN [Halarcobacter ebronensis]|uniref:Phosphonate metabolism protein/1,5-bisphosphokinase (PRPP-forming) PhnN n=1 Tax=Halarcobacter ebronensis TaxID=1462615 RepID=A0A4Q1AJG8_9BACT|nr:phosphonate metabolism protein/1,5-bisphosphokinase (PRPP-forming) PhnN [Halarcobacter ebronensis]QKF81945.1 ribose 1,5-bisphosphate phosphokinase [Halarcobacter ebronensis]RXK04336.1 phosphonate metabolism protein/1,5-bisphosphokinase (PRPP-forming) PhnN [Halarcobacter ebronensis]
MKSKIVLVVGPSGAGKDTLLRYAKQRLGERVNFVKRYITREADANENNYYIDEYAFEILKHNGYFASSWSAHGNFYGIPKRFIENGLNLISISRSKIKDFEKQYDDVITLNITLPKEKLRQRLISRDRESLEEIEKRLNRDYEKIECKKLIEFDNSALLEESKEKFLELLERIENE